MSNCNPIVYYQSYTARRCQPQIQRQCISPIYCQPQCQTRCFQTQCQPCPPPCPPPCPAPCPPCPLQSQSYNPCDPCYPYSYPCPTPTPVNPVTIAYIVTTPVPTNITSNAVGTAPTPIPVGSTVIPAGTVVPIINYPTTPITNIGGITVDPTTGFFTIPVAGNYAVSGAIVFTANTIGTREIYIYKIAAGTGVISLLASNSISAAASGFTSASAIVVTTLNAGDQIFFAATQNSGTTLTNAADSRFSIVRAYNNNNNNC